MPLIFLNFFKSIKNNTIVFTFIDVNSELKIGAMVAVLDDTIKGKVSVINGNQVTILTNDGFSLTYHNTELVLIKFDQKEYSKYIDIKHDNFIEKDISKKKFISKKLAKNKKQPPLEVDLHIHQLTSATKGMTNYEMLTLQLETAKKRLDFAIKKKMQRVVFIHGVGQGVLKKELEFLLAKYNVEVYAASFQKYGFGATEVYIYQNN